MAVLKRELEVRYLRIYLPSGTSRRCFQEALQQCRADQAGVVGQGSWMAGDTLICTFRCETARHHSGSHHIIGLARWEGRRRGSHERASPGQSAVGSCPVLATLFFPAVDLWISCGEGTAMIL